jgi:hypothetical protein
VRLPATLAEITGHARVPSRTEPPLLTAELDLSAGERVVPDSGEPRTSAMDIERFAETESALAVTDRLWRAEMRRVFGPDGVLLHGFGAERQGAPGTRLRTAFEARRRAIAAWRQVRRPAA